MSVVGQGDDDPRTRDDDGPVILSNELSDGVVLYDEEQPASAWIESKGEQGVAYLNVGPTKEGDDGRGG